MAAQVGALVLGIGYDFSEAGAASPHAEPSRATASLQPESSLPARPAVAPLPYSVPVQVTLERLGIDSPLMTLGLRPDRTVEVPPDAPDAPAGWYHELASPGEIGPAIILGHVDSDFGPGVFHLLGATTVGDQVLVRRSDGSTAVFTVDRVASVSRTAFPTEEVYGEIDHPGLRLITCGGEYDPDNGGYQENLVVFASLTDATTPSRSHLWWRPGSQS